MKIITDPNELEKMRDEINQQIIADGGPNSELVISVTYAAIMYDIEINNTILDS
jgi:hypothetical protein